MVLLRITVIHSTTALLRTSIVHHMANTACEGGGVVSESGKAERGSTGTDFSHLRPCLNGGLAGGGLAGVIRLPVSDHKRGVKVVSCQRGGWNPRRHQLLLYRARS